MHSTQIVILLRGYFLIALSKTENNTTSPEEGDRESQVALCLLEEHRLRGMRLEIRREIAVGIEPSDRGEVWNGEEVVQELLGEIE